MKIFVGNLGLEMRERDLLTVFGGHGVVTSVWIPIERSTGLNRGFGFVEMPAPAEARAAILALDDTALQGRTLRVNESQEMIRQGALKARR